MRVLEDRATEPRDVRLGYIAAWISKTIAEEEQLSSRLASELDHERRGSSELRLQLADARRDNARLSHELEMLAEKLDELRDAKGRPAV